MERKSAWSRLTLPLHQVVTRVSGALLVCLFSAVFVGVLLAQVDDPSDIFLKAYLSTQQGEKLEHENRFKAALAKYRFAGSLIEELRRSHSEWQPAIVQYRGRKIGEGILRVEERISRHNDLNAAASPLPEIVPSLPENDSWSEPGPEVVAPQGFNTVFRGSGDGAIEEATRRLRRKVDQLETALEKSHSDFETERKEKEAVNARLKETRSKLENAQKEIEASRESERQVRSQLTQKQASQENSTTEQLRAQIADLRNEVAVADAARATAERQRDEANAKLAEANKQIAAVAQQRDQAFTQLEGGSVTEQPVQTLLAESFDLKLAPPNLEKTVPADDNSTSAEELAGVKQQVTQLQQRLVESQKQNQYLVARISELWVQLDTTAAQLQSAKLNGKNSDETDRLMRENELLRNIVVRERKEEARREEARKVMLAELDRLKIKADALNREIELLAQPVTELSSQELSLLRQPAVPVSDQSRAGLTASFIFAKKSARDSVDGEASVTKSSGLKADVHDDTQSVAHAMKENSNGMSTGEEKAMSGNPDQGSE